MRKMIVMGAMCALAACGSSRVSGDVGKACMDSGRSAASPQLCSCIQGVASQALSGRDQARAATFFAEPQLAQDTRQSDRSSDEAFWLRYKDFAELASVLCEPTG